MQQTNGSLLQSKRQILQKDLSFSNEIFKRSFNYENIHSSKSSHQNLTKNNNIPPLIKYTDTIVSQNIHHQNYHHHPNTQTLTQRKQKITEQKQQLSLQQQQLNIFQRKNKPNLNSFNKSGNKQQKYSSSIPSLSKLQEKIARKYQKQQKNPNQQLKQVKPTTVYFDNTQSYQGQGGLNSSRNKILNIESLQQSRIANHSIERHNNWIINNIGDSSGFFQDNNNTLLSNLSKKQLSRKNINRSLMNNSFRNMNPLQLVNNSLHLSHLPQFVQDDQLSQQNIQQRENMYQKDNENQQTNVKTIQQKLRVFNTLNRNQQPNVKSKDREQRRQVNFKKLTLDLYQYYVVPQFGNSSKSNEFINQFQTSSIPDSILINDFQPQNNKGFDLLTTKSTPIHNQQKNSPFHQNYKTISQINEHLYIEENSFEDIQSNLRYGKSQQHFINDKSAQQIISAILSDPNKMKLYIKYLQLKIALNNKNSQNLKMNQKYQLLSCMLIKINEISDKNQPNLLLLTPKSLAQSIISLSQLKHHKQNNHFLQQKQLSNNNIKPQIIRSSNGIKINFDPYLTYETEKINSRILYIKKCLQQKNKQSQLIKLNYDSIIHNYATTLQNIANNNKNNQNKQQNPYSQTQRQNQYQNQNQNQNLSSNRKSQYQSQKFQQKNYLQININKNRSSFQQNKIHRKATFGKVPSSFKGSDIVDY